MLFKSNFAYISYNYIKYIKLSAYAKIVVLVTAVKNPAPKTSWRKYDHTEDSFRPKNILNNSSCIRLCIVTSIECIVTSIGGECFM